MYRVGVAHSAASCQLAVQGSGGSAAHSVVMRVNFEVAEGAQNSAKLSAAEAMGSPLEKD